MLQKQNNYYLTHPDKNSDMVAVRLLSVKCTCFWSSNQVVFYSYTPNPLQHVWHIRFFTSQLNIGLIGGRAGVTGAIDALMANVQRMTHPSASTISRFRSIVAKITIKHVFEGRVFWLSSNYELVVHYRQKQKLCRIIKQNNKSNKKTTDKKGCRNISISLERSNSVVEIWWC